MKSRQAHTLVELIVSMTVGSALMVLTVGLLHQSLSLASTARARANQYRAFDRLTQDFRRDVHLASDATSDESAADGSPAIELNRQDGAVIRYETIRDRSNGTRILRAERSDGAIVRQEAYDLEMPIEVSFATPSQPPRVIVTFASQADAIGKLRVPTRQIMAVLGRTLAMQRGEASR